jgi:hypothetical protein
MMMMRIRPRNRIRVRYLWHVKVYRICPFISTENLRFPTRMSRFPQKKNTRTRLSACDVVTAVSIVRDPFPTGRLVNEDAAKISGRACQMSCEEKRM